MTTLIDQLLEDQARLDTPVARFSRWHESGDGCPTPATERSYKRLIPLAAPAAGEQYAFEVNLDQCTGCKACVAACHSLNGLDEGETWRDTGALLGSLDGAPFQQVITTACHHCADPACASGCPVLAYEKDDATGIVRHLDDQCIGCSYCILKCPYDVPKFSKKRGIVRKCDMCHSRLAVGEAPACVQACPSEAIRIINVSRGAIELAGETPLLPGTFESGYTLPGTRYIGSRMTRARLTPTDAWQTKPEHTHWPLVVMLLLTQASVGLACAGVFATPSAHAHLSLVSLAAMLTGLVGIAASILHLGQPLKAWRAFLGLRRSWLSREVIGFGMYAPLVALVPLIDLLAPAPVQASLRLPVALSAALTGILCVICSVMVYVDTRRSFWRWQITCARFLGTMLVLGSALTWALAGSVVAFWCALAAMLVKLSCESRFLRDNPYNQNDPVEPGADARTAILLLEIMPYLTRGRIALAGIGLLSLYWQPWLGCVLFAGSELCERILYFRAVVAPHMPGVKS